MALAAGGCKNNSTVLTEEEGTYPNDWFYQQRSYPYQSMRSDLFYKALGQAVEMEDSGLKSGGAAWEPVGPTNTGGRITDVEMPVNSTDIIYAGAASGGIFKSANMGSSWTPVFDDALALAIGDIDISRSEPDLLFVGTGEPNAGGGSHTYEGFGVYKSADAGATWLHCGLENVGSIGRVKIDPQHPDTVYVAAMGHLFSDNQERGVFRTQNGGTTWQKVLYLSDSTGASDLAINMLNPKIIYAAMWERTRRPPYQSYGGKTSGLWRTSDGGDHWTELLTGLPKGNVGRIGIDISDTDPQRLYATYTDSTGYLLGIYTTRDGGDNWSACGSLGENSSYWWWFSEVDVDPINPNVAYVSGFNVYKTTNGGTTWNQTFTQAHVDMHGTFVHPRDNALALLCSDGGLYVSHSAGSTYFHSENLPITQFYTCEVDYQNPGRFYGGTQDNGTIRSLNYPNQWRSIYGGDGFVVKVDPTNNNYVYAQSQYGGLGRSTDGGTSFMGGTQGISGSDRKNWKSPLELDPQTPSTLYFGANRLYKSTNRAQSWQVVSPDMTKGPGVNVTYGTITTISVSPLDSKIIYTGTDDGNVWMTQNGGTNWTKVSATLPDRWITCVQTSPFDKATALVTISGYRWDSYLPHVYRTINNGATWEDVSSNLPDFPVNSIVIDPVIPGYWYIGTDGGVYMTRNSGVTWEVYGTGMPRITVFDLYLHAPTRTLTAATFGRSMFKITLPAAESSIAAELDFSGLKAWPNPFKTDLEITFQLEKPMDGELTVIDMTGRKIRMIHKGTFIQGENRFTWNGSGSAGSEAGPGLYLIRLTGTEVTATFRVQKI